ncbi:MAG: ribosome silencing factor [Desulfitobacteriaceae bacterium]
MEIEERELKQVVDFVGDKKGHDTVLLNLKGISMVTDYFLITTGNTTTQVKAIADYLGDKIETLGIPVLRVEGLPDAKWVLIDCGDLVVHIMTPDQRDFYNLERLWGDAEVLAY